MALTRTKFGTAQFDVSTFDYTFTAEQFETDAQNDFDEILKDRGRVFYLEQQTDTIDGMGNVSNISVTSIPIYMILQDITKKDRKIHDMGLAVMGSMKVFLKPNYTITSAGVDTTYTPKEDDILVYSDDTRWRILKIIKEEYSGNTRVFKTAIVQNIDLKGSE